MQPPMFDILHNFAEGNLNAEQTILKMNELRTSVTSLSDENIAQLAETILTKAPNVRDSFSKGIQKYSDNIEQQKLVSDAFKKYVTSIAERNADVHKVLSCFEPNYLLESQTQELLLEELKHADIPELLQAAKSSSALRNFADDNALWIPIAKRLGFDDIDPNKSVKELVKSRYQMLRQQIKDTPFLLNDAIAIKNEEVKTEMLKLPPTVQNILALQHHLIKARMRYRFRASIQQQDVKEALAVPSAENNHFLEKWMKARDKLTVWNKISQAAQIAMPTLDMTTGKKMIDQAEGFSAWMQANHAQLAILQDLDLSEQSLTSLPSEIGNLIGLTNLHLYNNRLISLPLEIGNLTALTALDLSLNKLTSVPPEIGNLSELTVLDLSQNKLTSLPPQIWNLTGLTTLNLSENRFDSLPSEIGNLTTLTNLYLDHNQLASLPSEIWNLTGLTDLNLGSNLIASLPHEIGLLHNLKNLYLENNQLTSLPQEIRNMITLTTLHLYGNMISSYPPTFFTNLVSLGDLRLR